MGQDERNYLSHRLFPNSFEEPFEITSPETAAYNCVAWAMHDSERWWEADENYFWKDGVALDNTISTFIQLFEQLGFTVCPDVSLEKSQEKIALFSNGDGDCSHVARQLESGLWTSKLGVSYDVVHTLNGIEGGIYGKVALIMQKAI